MCLLMYSIRIVVREGIKVRIMRVNMLYIHEISICYYCCCYFYFYYYYILLYLFIYLLYILI